MKKIKSLEIKNSPFFEDITIKFDEKMNCIMGGRGTGKSTLLYFLKSALSIDSQKGKTDGILKSNLGTGEINVEMESVDGSMYRIIKTFNEDPQPFKHPNSDFIALPRIINEIECDFYETNMIEEIGRTPIQRLELIDKKINIDIKDLKKQILTSQIELDANAQDIKTKNNQIKQLHNSIIQYENIDIDIEELQKNEPINIKPDEKIEFENADINEKKRTDEKRFFQKTAGLYNDLQNRISLIDNDLNEIYKNSILDKDNFLNKEILDEIIDITSINNSKLKLKFSEIIKIANQNKELIIDKYRLISVKHESQQAEFVQLKQKFESNRDYFNRLNILTNRKKEKELLSKDIIEIDQKKNRLIEERRMLIDKLNNLKNKIYTLRLSAIKDINNVLQGDVKITLKFSGIINEFENKLRDAMKGSGLRYNELVTKIVETFKPDQFAKVIQDKDIKTLKLISGIDEIRSETIIDSLFDTQDIYQIESIYCEDLPDFKLRIEGDLVLMDNYKNSDELSMGQRCTTVLPIIFAVSNNPLIIDQPEDNLDNKYISSKIHEIIRTQKNERQLIFITHNPNIPVLSDSEFNLFLNYENKKSDRLIEGTIENVKDEIITILEGGKVAFNKRKEIYDIK
ncbi:MAG: AAA family ATPase [Paludibacter sp.]|nr:AAA family ATPase [Paludibacter sp.]